MISKRSENARTIIIFYRLLAFSNTLFHAAFLHSRNIYPVALLGSIIPPHIFLGLVRKTSSSIRRITTEMKIGCRRYMKRGLNKQVNLDDRRLLTIAYISSISLSYSCIHRGLKRSVRIAVPKALISTQCQSHDLE